MINITLSLALDAPPLPIQRTIQRTLFLLEQHLRQPGVSFTSANTTRDWLRLRMAGLEREEFRALFLDNQHRLLAHDILFTGSISNTEVHPREIDTEAQRHSGRVGTLPPSGHAEPSDVM
ncbi:TPA: hypothetical protein SMF26_004463 [Serratia marcescens]|nr:hypothetical protein [Serratia marcescens]